MRLPPIPGRVKFRPRFGFRLHHPPVVERGAALPVRPAAEVYQSEETERDQEPASAGQKPGDQTVPPPDGTLPFLLEAIESQPRRREHRGLETVAAHEARHERVERPRGVTP